MLRNMDVLPQFAGPSERCGFCRKARELPERLEEKGSGGSLEQTGDMTDLSVARPRTHVLAFDGRV